MPGRRKDNSKGAPARKAPQTNDKLEALDPFREDGTEQLLTTNQDRWRASPRLSSRRSPSTGIGAAKLSRRRFRHDSRSTRSTRQQNTESS
jgi:hypothetical protein